MAKPKPQELPPTPKLRVYEVLLPLNNLQTGEITPPGSYVEYLEGEATTDLFILRGAIKLTNKKPLRREK